MSTKSDQRPRSILREPLAHFMLIGAALFAADWALSEPDLAPREDRIVVTAGEVDRLASFWEKRRLRQPSAAELEGLIEEYVREEVLYREALALGLDRDDVTIRRLLRQKYEFLTQDLAVAREPEPAKLRAWYEAHQDRYSAPARLSFTQVYFNTDRRGAGGERDAIVALASLQEDTTTAGALGDGQLLDMDYRDRSEEEIAAVFGQEFASAVSGLEPGAWSGPIRSGYGIHLVRLNARSPGEALPFEVVADQVRNDWAYEQRQEANEELYRRLLERYEVSVERAGTAAPARTAGTEDTR